MLTKAMPTNVKYAIKDTSITTLDEAMVKAYVMEKNMVEINPDLELILGRVMRHMTNLSVNNQHACTSRNE